MTDIAADETMTESVEQDLPWWRSPFRMFQTNLREADAVMDVDAALDAIEAHGATVWLINAGGIVSFYPSDLDFQTPNPALRERPSGDLLGDAVQAAHARGIRLMARMDFSKVAESVAIAHPDWWFIDPAGERQVYNGLTSVCPNGGYYQSAVFEVIGEVIDRYDVDGFFFNWFSFNEVDYSSRYRGVCHCDTCVRLFATETGGLDLPDGREHPHYDRWLTFSSAILRDLTVRFREYVAERAPQAGLILGRAADIMFHEGNNAFGRELWPHATGDAVSAFKSHRPEVPVLVNAVSFIDMPYRLASEQPEHFAQYLLQAIARGANPSTYIMGAPGDIKYAMLPIAGEITRFHRDHEDIYDGLRQAGSIALVRPDRLQFDSAAYAAAVDEFRGIRLALQETQQPIDIIAQEDLHEVGRDGRLRSYDLVVLPDLGSLLPAAAAAVDAYVAAGGAVLLTGSSGIGENGESQVASDPAVRLTERIADAERLKNTYVGHVGSEEDVSVRQSSSMVPVLGVLGLYDWEEGIERRGHYVSQAPFGPPEKTFGHSTTPHPAWASSVDGGGVTIRVPFTLGRSYRESSLDVVRDVVTEIVRSATGPTGISIDAPEQVEAIVSVSSGRTVIHLLNLSGLRRRGFGAPVPIRGVRVGGVGSARVRALVAGAELAVVDGAIEVPELGRFEVIVIDSEGEMP